MSKKLSNRSNIRLAVVLAISASAAACSSEPSYLPSADAQQATQEIGVNSIVAASQDLVDGQLLVELVTLEDTGGYVAVYEEVNSAPGELVGTSVLLAEGTHREVRIEVDRTDSEGQVFLMLHAERSGNEELNFPGPDGVLEEDGRLLSLTLSLSGS